MALKLKYMIIVPTSCIAALAPALGPQGGQVNCRGVFGTPAPESEVHHWSYRYNDVEEFRIDWPMAQVSWEETCSFKVIQYADAQRIASATLHSVVPDPDLEFSDWIDDLLAAGGPSEQEMVPFDGSSPNVDVTHEGDGCVVAVEHAPLLVPLGPLFLVFRDASGSVVQEILFGPLFDDGVSRVFVPKRELDIVRAR